MTAPPTTPAATSPAAGTTSTDQARAWLSWLDANPHLIDSGSYYFGRGDGPVASVRCTPSTEAAALASIGDYQTSDFEFLGNPIIRTHHFEVAGVDATLHVWPDPAEPEVCQHCGNPVHQ